MKQQQRNHSILRFPCGYKHVTKYRLYISISILFTKRLLGFLWKGAAFSPSYHLASLELHLSCDRLDAGLCIITALTCGKLSFHISIVEYDFRMKKDATHDFWIGALLWMLKRRHISPKCLEIPGGLLASPTNFPVAYCLLVSIGWWTLWRNFDCFWNSFTLWSETIKKVRWWERF